MVCEDSEYIILIMDKIKILIDKEEYDSLLKIKNNFKTLLEEKNKENQEYFLKQHEFLLQDLEWYKNCLHAYSKLHTALKSKPWIIKKLLGVHKLL